MKLEALRPALARLVLAASLLAAFVAPALACPVCFSAKEDVLPAYYATALGMTLAPFLLIASVGYGVHRHLRRKSQGGAEAGRGTAAP